MKRFLRSIRRARPAQWWVPCSPWRLLWPVRLAEDLRGAL